MSGTSTLLAFIKEHRSDEAHFDALYKRLVSESDDALQALRIEGEKRAAVYRQVKEKSGSAWPEFENFVSYYEKQLTIQNKPQS